jgi:hypothetical protein
VLNHQNVVEGGKAIFGVEIHRQACAEEATGGAVMCVRVCVCV